MLQQLKLANFRIFDDEVTVRFRPITVLIGRNNAGKSSIIKFLLMLQQSIDLPEFLSPDGPAVNLGPFPHLKNSKTKKRNLAFQLDLSHPASPGFNMTRYIKSLKDKNTDAELAPNKLKYSIKGSAAYATRQQYGKGTSSSFSMKHQDWKNQILGCSGRSLAGKNFIDLVSEGISENREAIGLNYLRPDNTGTIQDYRSEMLEVTAEEECIKIIKNDLESVRHLLPTRKPVQNIIMDSLPPSGMVGKNGQYALFHLKRIMDSEYGLDKQKFVCKYLSSVASIEKVQFNNLSYAIECTACDKETGAKTHLANFGFGAGQCVPIFVQGAIMPQHSCLMVEEPEAQLHPTAQLELSSFFAELWNKHKVCSIIETHSSNIILRLQKLIAKNQLKTEDVSIAFFDVQEGKAIIKNISIENDGSLQDGLPMEFFNQDIWEAMALGATEAQTD